MKYALMDGFGFVQNIIVYDGVEEFTPPENHTLTEIPDDVGIGWQNVSGTWTPPAAIPNPS